MSACSSVTEPSAMRFLWKEWCSWETDPPAVEGPQTNDIFIKKKPKPECLSLSLSHKQAHLIKLSNRSWTWWFMWIQLGTFNDFMNCHQCFWLSCFRIWWVTRKKNPESWFPFLFILQQKKEMVEMFARSLLDSHDNIWRGQISLPEQVCWREDGDWEGERSRVSRRSFSFPHISYWKWIEIAAYRHTSPACFRVTESTWIMGKNKKKLKIRHIDTV